MHLRFRDTRRSHVAPGPCIVSCREIFANELPVSCVTLHDTAIVDSLFSRARGTRAGVRADRARDRSWTADHTRPAFELANP